MRGRTDLQGAIFYSINVEQLVPAEHPLRGIRRLADEELKRLSPKFEAAYSKVGRPSIPPEQLIKASLLQALYSIRSERQLCEQLGYNLLFRWFVGLNPEEGVWDPTTFTQNRARFEEHGLYRAFFEGTVAAAIEKEAASVDHFSVDGTLIRAWASMKSVRPKGEPEDPSSGDSNRWVDWKGEKRSNETHESKTDPEARLARKGSGQETTLSHSLHVLMENRHGLLVNLAVEEANGTVERTAAVAMLKEVRARHWVRPSTLGADKGYDDGKFLREVEEDLGIEPHVPTRAGRIKGGDAEGWARLRARSREKSARHRKSQVLRRRIEEIFGWVKEVAMLRRTRFVGRWKTRLYAYAAGASYNLMRLSRVTA